MAQGRSIGNSVSRQAFVRTGASLLAIAAMGAAAPALAQDVPRDQAASPSPDAAQPAAAQDDEAIVVTGRRAALQSADDRKRNADTIIDSVVADEAGRLPDNSITEVLQRVSGVAIVRFAALNDPDHFSVEGSGIQVRGLSGVASRLNGREIFSANAGRSLLWGDVTPELMSAVDVYKSSSADQIEGGTGGSVDLRTKLPFDYSYGIHIAGSGDLGFGNLAREIDFSASGLVAGKWSTPIGDIGVLLDGAYSQFTSSSQFFRMEPYYRTRIGATDYFIPGGYDYGEDRYQRRRDGIYAAVQWEPGADLTFTGIFFQSRYRSSTEGNGSFVTSQGLAVNPATSQFNSNNELISSSSVFQRNSGTFQPSGNSIGSGGNTGVDRSRSVTQDMSLGFDWSPAHGPLSVRGSFQHVRSTGISDSLNLFRDFAFPTSFGIDLSGDLPQLSTPSSFPQSNFRDPSQYFWSAAMPHDQSNRGIMNTANLDLEYQVGDGFFKSLKVGGRWANRTERDFNNGFAWNALGRGWNGDPQLTFANAAPGDVELHVFRNFFGGATSVPTMLYPSIALTSRMDIDGVHRSPPAGFCGAPFATNLWWDCSAAGPLASSTYGNPNIRQSGFLLPDDQTDFRTRTLAAYAMTRFGTHIGGGELTGNAGVRIVKVRNVSSGYFTQNQTTFIRNGTTFVTAQRAAIRDESANFTRYLPAINVNYAPSSQVRIRGAYNITMDNGSFSALSAAGSLGVATTTNPNSTPQNNLPPIFTNYTTNAGNPRLRPAMSNNVDLSFEYYPRAGTTMHVAAFYKHVSNLPIYSIAYQPVTVYFANGTTEQTIATSTAVRNAEEAATVKGVEVGGRFFFDRLPGILRGLGVEANYTFLDSQNPGDLYRDIDGIQHNDAPLQGLSKHNFNVTLLYEHDPFSVRVAYSWRSSYLQSTNSNGTNPTYNYFTSPGSAGVSTPIALPVYGDAYGTLDAGVRVRVNDHFSFSIQGTNLAGSTQRTLMGGYPNNSRLVRSWFQSDRRVSMGVNVAF
jgi:iron complex outermembrane receptor protein